MIRYHEEAPKYIEMGNPKAQVSYSKLAFAPLIARIFGNNALGDSPLIERLKAALSRPYGGTQITEEVVFVSVD